MVDRHHPGKAPTALLQLLSDGAVLTVDDVEAKLDLTRRQISDAAACLLRRGYMHWLGPGKYQLNDAGHDAAANGEVITSGPLGSRKRVKEVRNTLRERAWRSMRLRRRFTVPDLVSDAATEDDGQPADNIQRFLRSLRDAGYVVELPRRAEGAAVTSNGFKRWMLAKDTGPRAPVYRPRSNRLHDFNTGEDVPCTPR